MLTAACLRVVNWLLRVIEYLRRRHPERVPAKFAVHVTECPYCGGPTEIVGVTTYPCSEGPTPHIGMKCFYGHTWLMPAAASGLQIIEEEMPGASE